MPKLEFKKKNWYQESEEEKTASLKAASDNPLFDTEKTVIKNFRVENLQRLKKLSEIAELPEPNAHHRYVTYHSFNAFTWIDLFLGKFDSFDEVFITSYNFSEAVITLLFEHFDAGKFKKLSLVISESIRFRMPKRYFQLKEGVESRNSPNLRLAGVWNHSKIILLKPSASDSRFVVEGSGNFSDNAFIEQYSVDNSKQIYDFHSTWMNDYVFNPANIDKNERN